MNDTASNIRISSLKVCVQSRAATKLHRFLLGLKYAKPARGVPAHRTGNWWCEDQAGSSRSIHFSQILGSDSIPMPFMIFVVVHGSGAGRGNRFFFQDQVGEERQLAMCSRQMDTLQRAQQFSHAHPSFWTPPAGCREEHVPTASVAPYPMHLRVVVRPLLPLFCRVCSSAFSVSIFHPWWNWSKKGTIESRLYGSP